MQLGTRWDAGTVPPAAVPPSLHPLIAAAEQDVLSTGATYPPRWTLTWLEGRPVAELDGGDIVTLSPDGSPVRRSYED